MYWHGCLFWYPKFKRYGNSHAYAAFMVWWDWLLTTVIHSPKQFWNHASVEVSFALHHGSRCFACRIERQLREQFLSAMDQFLDECHPTLLTLCFLDDLFVLDISKNPALQVELHIGSIPPTCDQNTHPVRGSITLKLGEVAGGKSSQESTSMILWI